MPEEIKKLKELEIGDIFHSAKALHTLYRDYVVRGKPEFNRGHGSSTRVCVNIARNTIESKSCRMEVIKTGESAMKELYKKSPISIK